MNLVRTERIWMNGTPQLSHLCHLTKNLYNEANYVTREAYFNNDKPVKYAEMDAWFKSNSENYKELNAQTAQQTLRLLEKDWNSFDANSKEYKINLSKFKGKPKPPQYKPKDGEAILIFTNQQAHIRNHILTLTKKLPLKIKTRLDNTKLNQVRFIPKGEGYICEIVYDKTIKRQTERQIICQRWYAKIKKPNNNYLGIDYGVSNIVTIGDNIGHQPIVIKDDGTGIKSINQFYNKKKAELQSIYDKRCIKFGTRMSQLNEKRYRKMEDAMHKISKFIINKCIKNDIETIIIGHNDGWKQNVNLGTKTNQKFVSIPYNRLTEKIQYKAQEEGITVIIQNESYTSKCSFLDSEPICHHNTYLGKRITRSFFKTAKGIIIHADVNGYLNIIRKAKPEAFSVDGVERCVLHPIRYNPLISRSNN